MYQARDTEKNNVVPTYIDTYVYCLYFTIYILFLIPLLVIVIHSLTYPFNPIHNPNLTTELFSGVNDRLNQFSNVKSSPITTTRIWTFDDSIYHLHWTSLVNIKSVLFLVFFPPQVRSPFRVNWEKKTGAMYRVCASADPWHSRFTLSIRRSRVWWTLFFFSFHSFMCKAPRDDSGFPYNIHGDIVRTHTCSDVLFLYLS